MIFNEINGIEQYFLALKILNKIKFKFYLELYCSGNFHNFTLKW